MNDHTSLCEGVVAQLYILCSVFVYVRDLIVSFVLVVCICTCLRVCARCTRVCECERLNTDFFFFERHCTIRRGCKVLAAVRIREDFYYNNLCVVILWASTKESKKKKKMGRHRTCWPDSDTYLAELRADVWCGILWAYVETPGELGRFQTSRFYYFSTINGLRSVYLG